MRPMTPFKFPPPPPPPPKAASSDAQAQNTYTSQRGGFHRGRGDKSRDRGRGRGGLGRGRGNYQSSSRGGYGQGDRTRDVHHQGGTRGGHQHSGTERQTQNSFHSPRQQHLQQFPQTSPLPNSSSIFGNPTFTNQPVPGTQGPQVDPGTLAQAMAFMSTPAGMQSMAAFANHMAGANAAPQDMQSASPHRSPYQNQQSPPQKGGVKRKRNERAVQWQAQQKQQLPSHAQQGGQKPPRVKAAAPPAVPSFGFSIPSAPSSQAPAAPKIHEKKRKVHLGLTNTQEDESESSADEDVDEEVTLASNMKVEGIVFEHEGERISLQTSLEIAAWIRDRRKKFPTKKRVKQKAEESASKRAAELDFLKKVTGRNSKRMSNIQHTSASRANTADDEGPLEKPRESIEALRKKVQESVVQKEAPPKEFIDNTKPVTGARPSAVDLGLGYDSETDLDSDDGSELSESSVVSSSEDSTEDSGSDSDDSDAPPQAQSSKTPVPPVIAPPAPPKRAVPAPKKAPPDVCPQWKKTGQCKFGRTCRYPHISKEEPKRVGLYEKMVQQELQKGDQMALDAIKYLGRHGFLG